MSRDWWNGTRLVAARALTEGFASRSWRAVTVLMLLAGIAAVVLPRMLGGGPTSYTLATVGRPPAELVTQLDAVARSGDFTVTYLALPGDAAVRQAVYDGDADVGLISTGAPVTGTSAGRLYVSQRESGPFPTLLSGVLRQQAVVGALTAAGLAPTRIAAIEATPPPQEVAVGPLSDESRTAVGFGSGIVLYLALIVSGTGIATTVATEKTTRVSEVLLAMLRPTQLLVGTVLGAGVLAVLQLAAVVVPIGVSYVVSDSPFLPAATAPDVALAVLWFVLGLCMYAFVIAALASLVDKMTEVNSAVLPVYLVLIVSYLIAITVVAVAPEGRLSVAASFFPLSAPLVMPTRWATGTVPAWQLAASMLLTAGTAVLLARVASAIYRRGVVRTGQRVRLRDALAAPRS